MNFLRPIFFSLILISCAQIEQEHESDISTESQSTTIAKSDSLLLDALIDSIWFSEKVQAKNQEIIQLSNNERHLTIILDDEQEDIYVKLAEDNGMNYVTHLTFVIKSSENYSIHFYDPIEDTKIDFQTWLDQR
ncbi:MAG: hypothetical protein R2780_13170 [Crocinitomicaceae bacterium]|nr:hypothetical protein [Crocinitomicaceae bacterium]